MEKRCTKCDTVKYLAEFAPRGQGYQSQCRTCTREYLNNYYRTSSDRAEKIRKHHLETKTRNRRIVHDYLLTHPCEECGESDPIVLEFDHIDRTTKKSGIAFLKANGCSSETLLEEISKCRVVCANCHRRHTYKQLGCKTYDIV